MKDLMKKLIYSLEQLSLQHLDQKHTDHLPNLLTGSPQNNRASIDLNNSMEVIMMKRMNFIRNSLETHDPKETTAHLR